MFLRLVAREMTMTTMMEAAADVEVLALKLVEINVKDSPTAQHLVVTPIAIIYATHHVVILVLIQPKVAVALLVKIALTAVLVAVVGLVRHVVELVYQHVQGVAQPLARGVHRLVEIVVLLRVGVLLVEDK